MDAFRILSGGARFDRKREDVAAFQPKKGPKASGSTLPTALDFFGSPTSTADAAAGEKKEAKKLKKRRRVEEAALQEELAEIDYPLILRKHRIKFTGLECPNPVMSITQLFTQGEKFGLDLENESNKVLRSNWETMGLGTPTAVQMAAWGIMLDKRDALICAPTGSGKTLAFVLPLLLSHPPTPSSAASSSTGIHRPTSIILEPTRELAMQVWRETTRLGAGGGWGVKVLGEEERAAGGGKKKKAGKKGKKTVEKAEGETAEVADVEEQEMEAVVVDKDGPGAPGSTDILITTPLRLIFAIKAKTVDLSSVLHLILDEADKLFELNFIEQTDEIISACSHPDLRKGMFSATMPSSVEELAASVLRQSIRAIIGHKDGATETIDQTLQFVGTENNKLLALRTLIATGFPPPVLIFVQSILRAKELANELTFDGISVDSINADRTAEERDQVVRGFAEGRIWCLVCTDVAARGLDFKGVKLVINYDFPQSGMSYIHRIGRTGRAGEKGKSITFFTKEDAPHLKSIVNVMRSSGCPVPEYMLDLSNPSQREKKNLRLKPINRKDVRQSNGAGGAVDKSEKRKVERKRLMGGKVERKEKKGKARDVEMTE